MKQTSYNVRHENIQPDHKELLALEKALDMVLVSPRVFWETLKIKTTG
ncbi:MAG: hypothetical protein ABIJ35_01010 [Acidobacteriota bacterium]